jgi:hypothetical protein
MTLWQEDKENNDIENSFKFTELSLQVYDVIFYLNDEKNFILYYFLVNE